LKRANKIQAQHALWPQRTYYSRNKTGITQIHKNKRRKEE